MVARHSPGYPLAGAPARQRACPAGAPLSFQRKRWERRGRGKVPPAPPKKQGPMAAVGCTDRAKPTVHCRPLRRHKFQIIRFAASGKAHSFHCALAPVAALRFPGQTGPPIAPLLFPGSLYPPLAALRRETLLTEPASLGFGGGPVFTYVTGAAAPGAARIGITPQALIAAALYRPGSPGRRRCHAAEKPWRLWWMVRVEWRDAKTRRSLDDSAGFSTFFCRSGEKAVTPPHPPLSWCTRCSVPPTAWDPRRRGHPS